MERFHVLKDSKIIGSAVTHDQAVFMIRQMQQYETHYMLRAEFSIIYGEEELIGYEDQETPPNQGRKEPL